MSGLDGFNGWILRLAGWVAGPERQEWLAAMAAETDSAGQDANNWAVGCLVAAVYDRLVRDRWFLFALVILPMSSLVIAIMLSLAVAIGARALDFPVEAALPIMLLGPLPAAWLLGVIRPTYAPLVVGTAGFMIHQAVPILAMWAIMGVPPHNFWSPNMTYYNMPALLGLFASWFVWVGGAGWGNRRYRHSGKVL